jgi:hypothetical protein
MIKARTIKMETILPNWLTQLAITILTGVILHHVSGISDKLDKLLVSDARQDVTISVHEARLAFLERYHRSPIPSMPQQPDVRLPDIYHKLDQRGIRPKDSIND